MTVATETLAALAQALAGFAVPQVRALHLPPLPWNGTKDAEFAALELDDGSLGLTYVLLDDTLASLAGGDAARTLAGADVLVLAQDWAGAAPARRALGFAAVNALTRHLFDRAGFVPPAAVDSFGGLQPRAGDHVGMVGFFPPLVKTVLAGGARLTVVELRRDLAGEREGFRITLDAAALEDCDDVLMTSTVLLNDTLDAMLAHCSRARAVAMVGPGAACLPDALFARGVTTLGGAWIADAEGFRRALAAGEPWGRHAVKFALTPAGYPGWRTLRERCR
jgi:uncharacterized protein (DUF4213/DUF364 family)